MIKELFIPPKTISLLTTYSCTATCKNCCFQCSPNIQKELSLKEMKNYIKQAVQAYSESLKVLVLTGGECFLLKDNLVKIVKYASQNHLITRVVTNGYWAYSYDKAYQQLEPLKEAGLKEINFSTGDDHQKWVSYENIVNGAMATIDLGLTCLINVETHDSCSFKVGSFFKDERLASYISPKNKTKKPLKIEAGVWIPFDNESSFTYENILLEDENQACSSLFNTIAINPYSTLLACCGLTSEYIPSMRLGDLKRNSLVKLYERQFLDFLKIWLYVEGPKKILEFIYNKKNVNKTIRGHMCYICAEIFKAPENIQFLRDYYKEVASSVLLKYSFARQSITKK